MGCDLPLRSELSKRRNYVVQQKNEQKKEREAKARRNGEEKEKASFSLFS